MKTQEALRSIMEEQGVGLSKLASRMEKPVNTISERLRQENISIEKLSEILRVLDYKVVILPSNTTVPKGGYEIK